MRKIALSDLSVAAVRALPDGTTLTFHETSRSRKWAQAWRIDDSNPDASLAVWFGPAHLVGWFEIERYVPPTLAHMVSPPWSDVKPLTEVRIFDPGEPHP